MASTPGSGATPEPLQKRRARSPRVLRCARYRVPARPRARAPRSAGPRGATRRPRRLGRRPRRPGARQPRRERVAGGRRGNLRAADASQHERDDIGRQNFALDASIKRHVYVVVVRFLATTVVALEFGGCGGCIRHAGGHSYDLMLWRVFTGSRCAQLGRGLAYATSRSQK